MDDLIDFLLARIDEDEDQARYATPGPWQAVRVNDRGDGWNVEALGSDGTHYDVAVDHARAAEGACDGSNSAHIARWNPLRALAECEAKRRIVEREADNRVPKPEAPITEVHSYGDNPSVMVNGERLTDDEYVERYTDPSIILRLLALPYAGHRDYRDRWRP